MTTHDPNPRDTEALLALMPWARQLAGRLVQSPELAEDLAQDACVVALQGRGFQEVQGESKAKAWLSTVTRHLAYRSHRGNAARQAREREVAKPESDPETPSDEVARMQMQRRLSDAVLKLDEPYRSTIILRFLDELSYAQIAARHSVSEAAVRQRVSRGLSQLRERLESEFGGDRSAMCLALVHFWRGDDAALAALSAGSALQIGGLAVGTKIQLSLAVSLLVALGAWFVQSRANPEELANAVVIDSPTELVKPPVDVETPRAEERLSALPKIEAPEPESTASPAGALALVDREHDLHGRVLNELGEVIAGAEIRCSKRPARSFNVLDLSFGDHVTEQRSTTTDALGEFKLRLPLGSPFELLVSKEGYAPTRVGPRQAGEFVEVRLSAGATLHGTVRAAEDSVPVAKCLLIGKLLSDPETVLFETRTDAEGRYSVSGLQEADLWLEVRPRKHDHIFKISLALPGEGELVHDIEVDTGHTVFGRVTDARTGLPISGVVLGEGWTLDRIVTSGDNGEYRFEGFARSGVYDVHTRAAGYVNSHKYLVDSKEDGIRLDFELVRGWSVTGRLVDETGQPIAGAYTAAVGSGVKVNHVVSADWRSSRSDQKGRFEIESLGGDQSYSLFIRAEGFEVASYDLADPAQSESAINLGTIVLRPGSLVAGVVLDEQGEPLQGQDVTLLGHNEDRERFGTSGFERFSNYAGKREVRTDDLGRFRFGDVAPGAYQVTVGRPSDGGDSAAFDVRRGEDMRGLELRANFGLRLFGTVVDEEGEPLSGILVLAFKEDGNGPPAGTDQSGIRGGFEMDRMENGLYRLQTMALGLNGEADQFLPATLQGVSPETDDLVLVVHKAVPTSGRVVWKDGTPVIRATVMPVMETPGIRASIHTDDEGRFTVGVAAGQMVDLRAVAPSDDPENPIFGDSGAPESTVSGVMAGSEGVLIELKRAD